MNTVKHFCCYMLCALFAAAFTACNKDAHENEYPLGGDEGAFIIGLQADVEVYNLNLFIFGSDGTTTVRNDYTDPRALALDYIPVKSDSYTIMVVANVTDNNLPALTTVADLAEWLEEHAAANPDMFTASAQESVAPGEIRRLSLSMQNGTDGIELSTLRLLLTVPGKELPAYTPSRAEAGNAPSLRLTAEVYREGTQTRIHRRVLLCTPQADGRYLAELSLLEGDYDLRLWADWTVDGTTNDRYYNTDDLSAVAVLTDNYVANGQTDGKDAYYAVATVGLNADAQDESITLIRPLARYRLVATDVEGYLSLMAKGEDLPPIDRLQVSVSYEGFFPTGFNVVSGKPNDAFTGIGYAAGIEEAEGYNPGEARQIGADFILTNGEESSVSVTVRIIDKNTGEAVSTLTGIQIPYRRGQLTTVTGTFLTAGRTSGGVEIDTDWKEDIVIEF